MIEHLKGKHAIRNEPMPEFWRVGEVDDIARFVVELLAHPDANLSGEIFGVNGSRVTLWQKPEPVFYENNIDAFFKEWVHRKGSK
ncbi:hypothetical protein D3C76_1551340 [compost metagenome]